MKGSDKKSKVALCKSCNGYIRACHTDYLDKKKELEFSDLTNCGYIVKIEKLSTTKSRQFMFYSSKNNGKCEKCNTIKNLEK